MIKGDICFWIRFVLQCNDDVNVFRSLNVYQLRCNFYFEPKKKKINVLLIPNTSLAT